MNNLIERVRETAGSFEYAFVFAKGNYAIVRRPLAGGDFEQFFDHRRAIYHGFNKHAGFDLSGVWACEDEAFAQARFQAIKHSIQMEGKLTRKRYAQALRENALKEASELRDKILDCSHPSLLPVRQELDQLQEIASMYPHTAGVLDYTLNVIRERGGEMYWAANIMALASGAGVESKEEASVEAA